MKLNHIFTPQAQKSEPAFDLVAAVKELYAESPEVSDILFIVDTLNYKITHPDETLAALVWEISKNYLQEKCESANEKGSSFFGEMPFLLRSDGDSDHSFIFIYNPPPPSGFGYNVPIQLTLLGGHTSPERAMRFVFNHEKAHALVSGGHDESDRNRSERIADAYALLKDCKMYGADEKLMISLARSRGEGVFLRGDKKHYTVPVIEGILAEHEKINFGLLSEDDIKKMTVSFVERCPFREEHRQHLEQLISAYETIYKPAQQETEQREKQPVKPVIKTLSEQRVITNLSGKLQNLRKPKA